MDALDTKVVYLGSSLYDMDIGSGDLREDVEPFDLSYVRRIFDCLTVQEEKVIWMHYGLGGRELNLAEIARTLYLNPTRISVVHKNALRKLKHPGRQRMFREVTEGDDDSPLTWRSS